MLFGFFLNQKGFNLRPFGFPEIPFGLFEVLKGFFFNPRRFFFDRLGFVSNPRRLFFNRLGFFFNPCRLFFNRLGFFFGLFYCSNSLKVSYFRRIGRFFSHGSLASGGLGLCCLAGEPSGERNGFRLRRKNIRSTLEARCRKNHKKPNAPAQQRG